jgi:hypothetical protein
VVLGRIGGIQRIARAFIIIPSLDLPAAGKQMVAIRQGLRVAKHSSKGLYFLAFVAVH